MKQAFVVAPPTVPLVPLIRRIWRVDADQSYHVTPNPADDGTWRIVRTLDGSGEIELEGHPLLFPRAGSMIAFPFHSVRHYRCLGGAWSFWWFEVSFPHAQPASEVINVFADPRPEERPLLESIWENLQIPAIERRKLGSATLAYLLAIWLAAPGYGSNNAAARIARLLAALPLTLAEPWRVTEMAREAGMSERAFRDAFRTFTGQAPAEYLAKLRLAVAAEQLRTTSQPIQTIAADLAYSSAFHFSRAFRSAYGMAPRDYRAAQTKSGHKARD